MLAHAICTELGAVMFDLSPENIAGKYEGKEGLTMLVHLVDKMSRLLQPSVIFIDGTEKVFYKSVPKTEKDIDPKRLKSQLPKIVKGIKNDDQVLVLGLSNKPWEAKPKPLVKSYNKFILIPRPDYGSTILVWEEFLRNHHAFNRSFDVSSLAKMSVGYSVGTIETVVKQIMTDRRILSQTYNPVTPKEFFDVLLQMEPTSVKEETKFVDWYNKWTPLGKRLTERLKEQEELEKEKKESSKSKKKKK